MNGTGPPTAKDIRRRLLADSDILSEYIVFRTIAEGSCPPELRKHEERIVSLIDRLEGVSYIPAPPEGAPEYWELARAIVEWYDSPKVPTGIRDATAKLRSLARSLRPLVPEENPER